MISPGPRHSGAALLLVLLALLVAAPWFANDYVLTVVADSEGKIYWDQWAPESHDFGVRFYLTARDTRSRAQTTFTDGNRVTFSNTADGAAVSDFGTVAQNVCRAAFVQERQGNNLDTDGHIARPVALSSNPANATLCFR